MIKLIYFIIYITIIIAINVVMICNFKIWKDNNFYLSFGALLIMIDVLTISMIIPTIKYIVRKW